MCDTVRVALHIRPLVGSEKGCGMCLNIVPGEPQVVWSDKKSSHQFTYNHVFPQDVKQEDFYDTAIKRLIENTFQGNISSKYFSFLTRQVSLLFRYNVALALY